MEEEEEEKERVRESLGDWGGGGGGGGGGFRMVEGWRRVAKGEASRPGWKNREQSEGAAS